LANFAGQSSVCTGKDTAYFFDGVRWCLDEASARLHGLVADKVYPWMLEQLEPMEVSLQLYQAELARRGASASTEAKNATAATNKATNKAASLQEPELKAKVKALQVAVERMQRASDVFGSHTLRGDSIKEFQKQSMAATTGFEERLDEDHNLLGFEDCVLDLRTMQTRPGQASDHLTMSTGYPFPTEVLPEVREELEQLVASMFRTQEMVDYVLNILAYSLIGNKYLEELYFFIGAGRNGKTLLVFLLSLVLGRAVMGGSGAPGYYYMPPSTFFT
jgi:phage/plasmid-associated DNA primase